MDPIHNIARHQFPVMSEPFFVDQSYEFVKELGQGPFRPLSSPTAPGGTAGSLVILHEC